MKVLSFQVLVESVFDLAHGPSKKWLHFGDLAPLRSDTLVHFKDELIFFFGPLSSNDRWIENIMPPFAALAAKSTGKVPGNDDPVLGSKLINLGTKKLVLLRGPLITSGRNIRNRLGILSLFLAFTEVEPSLEAPDLSLFRHELAKSMPRLVSVDLHKSGKFVILQAKWLIIE